MNWSDLTPNQKAQIEREYKGGAEPGEIAPKYGLKPKQVSDQAYRKKWTKPAGKKASKKKAKKKASKKKAGKKKAKKKASKKKAKKKASKKRTKKR